MEMVIAMGKMQSRNLVTPTDIVANDAAAE